MNNKINNITPITISKNELNKNSIIQLGDTKYIKIKENYTLTKKDYDLLLLYSNVEQIDVEDVEDFEYQNDLKININKKIQFKSKQFQKLTINKVDKYNKNSLTLTLPFKMYFEEDCLYSEEDDFNKLLNYIDELEMLNINLEEINTIDKVIETIKKIENKTNKKIKFINCITKNKTIPQIEKLKQLEDGRIIKIWYEDGITDCTIDEFIIMRKNLDKIITDIKTKKLTNFETIIYVYDIAKKFKYKKSEDNYSMEGRQLHKIFNTDKIICSGYTRIISQVLNELGIKTGIYKLITKDNQLHARNIVYIKDEKYDINCIYSMEPTWESALKEEYSYSLFLTPIKELKKSLKLERFRKDIDVLCGEKTINEISLMDRISLYQFFNNKDLSQSEIEKIIKIANKKASLENFMQALINVKTAQGISKNIISVNVNNIINYNNNLTQYLNKKMGININFF